MIGRGGSGAQRVTCDVCPNSSLRRRCSTGEAKTNYHATKRADKEIEKLGSDVSKIVSVNIAVNGLYQATNETYTREALGKAQLRGVSVGPSRQV